MLTYKQWYERHCLVAKSIDEEIVEYDLVTWKDFAMDHNVSSLDAIAWACASESEALGKHFFTVYDPRKGKVIKQASCGKDECQLNFHYGVLYDLYKKGKLG